jgi:hypothetical protein
MTLNLKKIATYAGLYVVGIYAFQRLTGKQLGLPAVLDPLGALLGYPPPGISAVPAGSTGAIAAAMRAVSSPPQVPTPDNVLNFPGVPGGMT